MTEQQFESSLKEVESELSKEKFVKPQVKLSQQDKNAYLQPENLVSETITEEMQNLVEKYVREGVTKAMIVLGSPDETDESKLTYLYVEKERK